MSKANRVAAFIETHRGEPFVWGSNDCALFAANCVAFLGGEDHGKFFRGRYRSPRGALSRIRKFGCASVVEVADKCLGARKPIAFARVGDVVAADLVRLGIGEDDRLGPSLGICNGRFSYFVGEDGLVSVDTFKCEHAYG